MEEWDVYTRREYKRICEVAEKNMLLDPGKRTKYLRDKADRERREQLIRKRENRIKVMY